MGWAATAELRANGLWQAHIVGDAGDPLFINIDIVADIEVPWGDFTWKSEVRANLQSSGDATATFSIDDNGTTDTELHITLTLDTTPLKSGCNNHFDVRSTGESPVVPFTCARGVIVPSPTVTRP